MTTSTSNAVKARPLPIHQRLRRHILDQIMSGAWPTHSRVPSENELSAQFGASRMTIRNAVKALERDGVLHAVQGLGTFVAAPFTHETVFRLTDIRDDIVSRGGTHRMEILVRERRPASAAERAEFRLVAAAELFHTVIVHFDGDVPVQIEDRLVNPAAAPGYADLDLRRTTAFSYLMELYPYPHGRHRLRSIAATGDVQCQLQLAEGEALIEIERTTWTPKAVVTQVRLLYPAKGFELCGDIAVPG